MSKSSPENQPQNEYLIPFTIFLGGIVFGPLAVSTVYLWVSRTTGIIDQRLDESVLLLSTVFGCGFIFFVPLSRDFPATRLFRSACALLYAVACYKLLFWYSLYFVGFVFNRWL